MLVYPWFTHEAQPLIRWAPRLRLLGALQKRHAATEGGGHQAAWRGSLLSSTGGICDDDDDDGDDGDDDDLFHEMLMIHLMIHDLTISNRTFKGSTHCTRPTWHLTKFARNSGTFCETCGD